ncbi:MAG: multidrug DMT transporter permease, partial [Paraburkholderia sp.]
MLMQHAEPTTGDVPAVQADVRAYAWVVFALTVGLLLSDYMSRQVLNAVFPLLKAAWTLSDTRLGSLSSVVALMVGVLTFPLSVLADRWGRVKCI